MSREFVNGGCVGTASTQKVSWGNILTTNNPLTCAFLFRLRANGSSSYDVVWGHSTASWFFILSGAAGSTRKLSFNFQSGTGEKSSGFITNNLTLNTWYSIFGGHDSGGGADNTFIRVYDMSGVLVDSSTGTNAVSMSSTFNSLAAGYDSIRSNPVNAQYKNFRIWSRTLSTIEQDALALNQSVDRSSLELETQCNEIEGTTLRDTASNSNARPATLTGTPVMSPDVPILFTRSRVLNN